MSPQSVQVIPRRLGSAVTRREKVRLWQLVGFVRERIRRRRELQHLIELEDRLLVDVGITRQQARAALSRERGS